MMAFQLLATGRLNLYIRFKGAHTDEGRKSTKYDSTEDNRRK
jgi:hypothetical protein